MCSTLILPWILLLWPAVYAETYFPSEVTSSGLTSGPSSPDCRLPCPQGYLPGSCLCQGSFFAFLFPSTPCRFTSCPAGNKCRVENGRAVCVTEARIAPSVDVCSLPAAKGPCNGNIKRVFFDRLDGTCKTFTYGGCQGNGNSFGSKSECESTCLVSIPAATIVDSSGTSNSNSNSVDGQQQSSSGGQAQNAACLLPAEPGPCPRFAPAFFFNGSSGQCQGFLYGGCLGNPNRFQTVQECQQACRGARQQQPQQTPAASLWSGANGERYPSVNSACNLPKSPGLCWAYIPAYFYNPQSGQCEVFIYGGCQGNANRFQTLPECQWRCQQATTIVGRQNPGAAAAMATATLPPASACLQPRAVGRCRASMPRWHYNPETAACEPFSYGGCDGNDNNFDSQAACEQLCVRGARAGQQQQQQPPPQSYSLQQAPLAASPAAVAPAVCSLPRETGPCRAMMLSFYYDTDQRKCLTFVYGGCSGNGNRFETEEECRSTCESSAGSPVQQPALGLNTGPASGPSDIVPDYNNY